MQLHRYVVEFIGTFAIMTVILLYGNYLAIGAIVGLAVMFGGAISGGAFNPAVAIAMMFSGLIPSADLMPYIVAEIAGAVVAIDAVKLFTDSNI